MGASVVRRRVGAPVRKDGIRYSFRRDVDEHAPFAHSQTQAFTGGACAPPAAILDVDGDARRRRLPPRGRAAPGAARGTARLPSIQTVVLEARSASFRRVSERLGRLEMTHSADRLTFASGL